MDELPIFCQFQTRNAGFIGNPTIKSVVDFHHQVVAHAGRTKKIVQDKTLNDFFNICFSNDNNHISPFLLIMKIIR